MNAFRHTRNFVIAMLATPAVHASFSYGAQLNYLGLTGTSTATINNATVVTKSDAGGFLVLGNFHYNLAVAGFSIGAGPLLGFGKVTPNLVNAPATTNDISIFRTGVEIMVTFLGFPAFKPFFRGGIGKDFLTETTTYAVGSNFLSAVTSSGPIQWSANLGVKYPFNDVLSIFVQGGICGAGKSAMALKSSSGDFAAAGIALVSDAQFSYSCYNMGGGLSFDL